MTERRGACPTLFDPTPSGDGLLVRVTPPRGRLNEVAARALAEAAGRCGNGIIELTSRGNLQIRGLSPESAGPFAAAMIACGVANADADAERRRNAMASPLLGDDPTLAQETEAIAAAIERGLIQERRFAALPPKFGIMVDGGGVLPLDGIGADIVVRAAGNAFAVSLDGSRLAAACAPEQAAASALGLAHAFLDLAATLPLAPRRMRELVQAVGAAAVFSAAGMDVRCLANERHDVERSSNPIGYSAYPGLGRGAFGLGLPFGQMTSGTLTALADIASRFGDGMVRTTPWRAVLVAGVIGRSAAELRKSAEQADMIVDPADPRRNVVACPGHPACASGSVAARADAAFLAPSAAPRSGIVHVSGCGKGCAHRDPAVFTLVGAAGRYGLVRNGSAADMPEIDGLTIAEAADLIRGEIAA